MSYLALGKNIQEAKKIIRDLKKITYNLKYSDPKERDFYLKSLNSLMLRLKMINDAIPSLTESISLKSNNVSVESATREDIVDLKYSSPIKNETSFISIKEDRARFLKELSLSEGNMKKIGSLKSQVVSIRPSRVAKISSSIFGKIATKFRGKIFEEDLRNDLKFSNSRFLLTTYISIALFFSLILFAVGLIGVVVFSIFNISALMFIWAPFLVLFLSLVAFYLYPSFEKSAIDKKIDNELPFAIIYMSAIAGANADPTKIFKIVADSSEYQNIGTEMKKIINQIEIYGYDLVTALKNVSKTTINFRLSQILGGMATNISSGSSLKNFLEKQSESLLRDYKMDREKYNSVATTFMDVYISVLITAPLVMVMLIVIMSLTSLSIGNLSTDSMVGISIGLVIFVNIVFLIFLQIKQPKT